MEKDIDKKEALAAAMKQIEKQFGKGSIMRMGDIGNIDVKSVSTGILPLDVPKMIETLTEVLK